LVAGTFTMSQAQISVSVWHQTDVLLNNKFVGYSYRSYLPELAPPPEDVRPFSTDFVHSSGIRVGFPIRPRLSATAGLAYTRSFHNNCNIDRPAWEVASRLCYPVTAVRLEILEIPISIQYDWLQVPRFRAYAAPGFAHGYWFGETAFDRYTELKSDFDVAPYHRVTARAQVTAGFEWEIFKQVRVAAEPNLNMLASSGLPNRFHVGIGTTLSYVFKN
ncbi:MAG: hypothetical protein AAF570_13525, partial [Bacteroidota bacterium]